MEFICKFKSKINDVVTGIEYELYDLNEENYLIKWQSLGFDFERKDSKEFVDKLFENGKYVKVSEEITDDIELVKCYYHGIRPLTKGELIRLQDSFIRGLTQVTKQINSI